MSSKVITVPEANKNGGGEIEPDNEGGLGKQRNFYRHVSGAGEGHPLQTTAAFGPNSPAHIVKPHLEDEEVDNAGQDALVTTMSTNQESEAAVSEKSDVRIDTDWQKKIRSLQDQILAVLLNVDKDKVDVTIGRTSIQRDKAVVLAWNKSQQNMAPVIPDEQSFTAPVRPDIIADELHEDQQQQQQQLQPEEPEEDGVLLYLAIKVKDEFKDQKEDNMRRLFRNDFNNNPGTIQKKVKKIVVKKVQNANGEFEEVEVRVNKRKVTRNVIDEKSGRVLEVETEVTTEDSDEDVLNPDGTIGKKTKRRTRRGKTGGQGKQSRRRMTSQGEEPRRVMRKKSRRVKLSPAEIQKGIVSGTIKKSSVDENGDYFKEEEYYEEEEEEYYSDDDEYYDEDEEEYSDEYDDDAEIVDVSRGGRSKLGSRGRKYADMRRRGKRMSRLEQARYQRRYCGHGKPGAIPEEQSRAKYGRNNARRTKSLGGEDDDDDEDDDYFFDNVYSNVNYWRHEYCFDEFQGYGGEYDGPLGVLTSYLPDGTSVKAHKHHNHKDKTKKDDTESDNYGEESPTKSKKGGLDRRLSKVSTIPEEDNEHEDASQANNDREECCTPTDGRNLLSRAVQVPNRIRRLRTRHIQPPKNLWFTGSVDKSFNSRCSKRFETKDLEEDAVHYYYYRSLPKINAVPDGYTPSITSSLENVEPPKLPRVIRRAEDLLL